MGKGGSVSGIGEVTPGQVVDKEALLSGAAFGVVDFPVPGLGIIKIRPLSRSEAMSVYKRELDAAQMEQVLVSLSCVEPTFTPGEIEQWQEHSTAGGPLFAMVNRILEISGMEIGTGKAAYQRFRGPA